MRTWWSNEAKERNLNENETVAASRTNQIRLLAVQML